MSQFPKDFLWGVACASYQCEGGWDADGKGLNIWDEFCHDKKGQHIKNGDTGDVACDTYHRFREDVALMKAHNVLAYRFSISWARVMPDGEGAVNAAGLKFYDDLVNELLDAGIEPMITLYHWDLPSALQDKGGWLNREIVPKFGRYARLIAQTFQGRVNKYMTINEPQCIACLGYASGAHAPGWKLSEEKVAQVYHVLALAHSEAQRQIKAVCGPDVRVGIVPTGRLCYPVVDTPEAREAAYRASFDISDNWMFSHGIIMDPLVFRKYDPSAPEAVKAFAATIPQEEWDAMETPDFIGVNVYQGDPVDEKGNLLPLPSGYPLTGIKWKISPEVMHYGPMHIYRRYQLPVYISENGVSCNDRIYLDGKVHDLDRIDFLHRYLRELSKATEEGTPVLGYLQWSFLDNFEWSEGYNERFGLIYVDYATCDRTPKDSARWYADVIASNGEIL